MINVEPTVRNRVTNRLEKERPWECMEWRLCLLFSI